MKPTHKDVELMQRINRGRPVIDGPEGVFMRWDAVMEAIAEARHEEQSRMVELAHRYASFYPHGSDGRNTFEIYADAVTNGNAL